MKQTLFMKQLSTYFDEYLPAVRRCSERTINSYADGFIILFRFFQEEKGEKHYLIDYKDLTPQLLDEYVLWMQNTMNYSAATQKLRIAAVSSFLKYASRREMKALSSLNAVSGVQTPKIPRISAPYFTIEEITVILHLPPLDRDNGIRDAALLCLMYDSGARAQEMCDIQVGDIKLGKTSTVKLRGKGLKVREVPISEETAKIIKKYLDVMGLQGKLSEPLFSSQRSAKMTTASIRYTVQKYISEAKKSSPGMFLDRGYSPHSFRHSKAIHLLKAGVPLIYIRNFLGHESVQTTEVYLRMNQESVAEILQKRTVKLPAPRTSDIVQGQNEIPQFLQRARK